MVCAGAWLVTGFVFPGDPMACLNIRAKPTENGAQTEQGAKKISFTLQQMLREKVCIGLV